MAEPLDLIGVNWLRPVFVALVESLRSVAAWQLMLAIGTTLFAVFGLGFGPTGRGPLGRAILDTFMTYPLLRLSIDRQPQTTASWKTECLSVDRRIPQLRHNAILSTPLAWQSIQRWIDDGFPVDQERVMDKRPSADGTTGQPRSRLWRLLKPIFFLGLATSLFSAGFSLGTRRGAPPPFPEPRIGSDPWAIIPSPGEMATTQDTSLDEMLDVWRRNEVAFEDRFTFRVFRMPVRVDRVLPMQSDEFPNMSRLVHSIAGDTLVAIFDFTAEQRDDIGTLRKGETYTVEGQVGGFDGQTLWFIRCRLPDQRNP